MAMSAPHPAVVCLMGPTACGKTDLAVELVRRGPFEIVSVDSALVYRGMDIGTAKPDAATLARAPHRLIDLLDPAERYSAGRFRADALQAIDEIIAAGRIPLLVGGTLLYFRALMHGLAALPTADAALRARLAADFAAHGAPALHARLAQVDPHAAARIHPHDVQRIGRALEVYELTGTALSEQWQTARGEVPALRWVCFALAPPARETLHARIERRFDHMLEAGFVAEVERLRARGDLHPDLPSMRAVGYRQVWEHLDGLTDRAAMRQRALAATRQFAKRQLTWLRAERQAIWLDSQAPALLRNVFERLRSEGIVPG
ncbi:tRNA dimethylallyltransferase [Plasticicumulans lactativorans]|uniref:tRNA dimethylallyltransferase n=2 Tax=Plasticicumulans lactativorans TaxID=1133106 RepID=A0A4R2KZS7_9GAMM|nr:tRNA dimethylallyltransferase [Plasticicumulans lactativorans]